MSTTLQMRPYVRKPKPFSAIRITEENAEEVRRMVGGNLQRGGTHGSPVRIYFHCCNGRVCAELGDWIVRTGHTYSRMTNEEMIRDCEELSA